MTISSQYAKAYEITGRLIARWAAFESSMFAVTRRLAEPKRYTTSYDVNRYLINGLRYHDMTKTALNLCRIRKVDEAALNSINEVVTAANKVKAFRDLVAHRQFTIVGQKDWRFEFHLWNQRNPDSPNVAYYLPNELEACSEYIQKLDTRVKSEVAQLVRGEEPKISARTLAELNELPPIPSLPSDDESRTEERAGGLYEFWRYGF
jgi:hypothetical protein